jgi:hypothetical protein
MYITYTISLSVFSGASSFIRCSSIYNNTCIHIDLLAAHNDEGCPDNIHTHTHIFQVSMPRKRPACIITIMDNSRDLKTHTCRQLNERLNQAPQICSIFLFDLENYRLVLSLSHSFLFLFFLVVSIFS